MISLQRANQKLHCRRRYCQATDRKDGGAVHRDLRAAAVGRRHRPLHQPMGQDQGQRPVSRSIKSRFFLPFMAKPPFYKLTLRYIAFSFKPNLILIQISMN